MQLASDLLLQIEQVLMLIGMTDQATKQACRNEKIALDHLG
ncbi:hypothetical protein [Pseudoalteromonas sp. McH1-7]|nr:hypothetical protein [Pseudoalteromonas sp. McH1-7]